VPEMRAHVTECQCPHVVCECCKAMRAPVPREVQGNFGPRLTALVAYLTASCRGPRRIVDVMLSEVLGIDMGRGSSRTRGKKPVMHWRSCTRN
jgi:hypothetical protein